MSIVKDRDGRKTVYIATCDLCGAELPPESLWIETVEAKKANGWRSRKIDGEWEDICPDCQSERRAYTRSKEKWKNTN